MVEMARIEINFLVRKEVTQAAITHQFQRFQSFRCDMARHHETTKDTVFTSTFTSKSTRYDGIYM